MAEIRALIADDEPLARRGIRQLLAPHRDVVVVGECRDGRETVRALETLKPALLFLDVQMPGLDGFGVIRARGADRMPAVVFVTAYDEFAVQAFEANALDYLVKPLTESRFNATLVRVRERLRMADAVALASRLAAVLATDEVRRAPAVPAIAPHGPATSPDGAPNRLIVPTATGVLALDLREIDWIEARDYYAAVHAGGRQYLVRESLRSLERRLDPAWFRRIHRGAIVRLDQVRELRQNSAGETAAILRDGTRVPVSRRRRDQLVMAMRGTG